MNTQDKTELRREFDNLGKKGPKRRTEADNIRFDELRAILGVPKAPMKLPKPEAIKADLRKVLGDLHELTDKLKTTNLPTTSQEQFQQPLQPGETRVAVFHKTTESTGVSLQPTQPPVEQHVVYFPPSRERLVHLLSWAGMNLNLFSKPMYENHPQAAVREKFFATMREIEEIVANEQQS